MLQSQLSPPVRDRRPAGTQSSEATHTPTLEHPSVGVVDTVQGLHGNDAVQHALGDSEASGPAGLIASATRMGLAGVDARELVPGYAPLSVMRAHMQAEGSGGKATPETTLPDAIAEHTERRCGPAATLQAVGAESSLEVAAEMPAHVDLVDWIDQLLAS